MPTPRPSAERPGTDADRLHALLDAHRLITADLALPSMLHRIVRAACDLVGATYGALGVLAPGGSIEHFVHTGLDAETVTRIGELPRGRGLLGAVLHVPVAVRVDDVSTDPRAGGFPPHHPPMRSFLGVPIRVRGAAFGELYLAHPEPARFDDADEDLVTALAASAGTAIENARLLDQSRRSRDWLTASGAVARTLLADADEEVLLDVVSQALDIAEADYAALILPTDDGRLKVTLARGVGADDFLGYVFAPGASPLGRAIAAGEPCAVTELAEWANPDYVNRHGFGPAMLAPLSDVHGTRGAVLLMRHRSRPAFRLEDVQQASTFAAQVALALELHDARGDAEWLRVVEDRHRIAQDLHDNVMQRLFATGVGLQALADDDRMEPVLAARLRRHVADLDQTIEEIRARVFGLRATEPPPVRHPRGRYPHVPPEAATGESDRPGRAESGNVRTLGTQTTRDQDQGVPIR